MSNVLVGCMIGKVPRDVIISYRSLLDFIYLAQYPSHDDDTLAYMEKTLKDFHHHKNILFNLGVREHLDIPKIHSLLHYVDSITWFGTTDNYNTEMMKHFHIDFCKEGWYASNHRNEMPQMISWLSRREKKHTCPGFQRDLTHFINSFNNNNIAGGRLRNASLPFSSLDVYHGFRFSLNDLGNDVNLNLGNEEIDSVKAKPKSLGSPARFDTVNDSILGARIGHLRVIFRLPTKLYGSWTAPSTWPSEPLA
ncbi:hypothetical protein C8R48DRAFT_747586 [Suillus tomentosus]|nr:hypothetical protein C8R48DRAFT_747586 [Suillus tomentosus]